MLYFIYLLVFLFIYEGETFKIEDINEKVYYNISNARELFEDYVNTFDKSYESGEYEERLEVFTRNLEDINHLNTMGDAIFGINEFTDYKDHELNLGGCLPEWPPAFDNDTEIDLGELKAAPPQWDWRQQRAVTPVKSQGVCQSCWAFSAVGVIEGLYARTKKQLTSLSAQEILDCSRGGNCERGGWPHNALNGIAQKGVVPDNSYPYVGRQQQCRLNPSNVVFKFRGGQQIRPRSEEHLKEILYNHGPVSIAVQTIGTKWEKYTNGVATSQRLGCTRQKQDHAVLLVGYGDANGTPYWIVKNSWGAQWGEQGFIKLARNQNTCGMAEYAAVAMA